MSTIGSGISVGIGISAILLRPLLLLALLGNSLFMKILLPLERHQKVLNLYELWIIGADTLGLHLPEFL